METLQIRYNSTRTALSACCPNCVNAGKTKDTKFHLYIVPNKFAFCFRCGFKVNYNRFKQLYRIDTSRIKEANQEVQESYPINKEFQVKLKGEVIEFNDLLYSQSALGYLTKRKINGELIRYMNIKLGINKLFGRVVFVDDINSYYVARSFLPSVKPKTLNPTGELKPLMYFRKRDYNTIYLVEGTFDAVPYVKNNKDVMVILGKEISQFQLTQLSSVNIDNIVISLDADAMESSKKLANTIAGKLPLSNIGIVMYNKNEGKDPSDYDVEFFSKTSILWVRLVNEKRI